MAESFLEALNRIQGDPAPGAAPLPTRYSQLQVPQGVLRDADTRTAPSGEVFRTAGINAPELKTPDKQLIPEGQQATARTADLFQQNPQTQIVRYGQDYHGRTVADDVTPDGRPIAAQQVRQGLAEPVDYNHSGVTRFMPERTQRFMDEHPMGAETVARAAYRGETPLRPGAASIKLDPKNRTLGEELNAGLRRGVNQAQAGLYGAESMIGALIKNDRGGREPRGMDEKLLTLRDRISNWLERNGEKGFMRNMEQAQQSPAAYHLKDVQEGKADLLQWGLGVLGEALPSTATMALAATATSGVGAGLGAVAGRSAAAPLLRQIATKSAEDLMTSAVRRRLLAMGATEGTTLTPAIVQRAALSVARDPIKAMMGTYAKRAGFLGAWGGSAAMEGGHNYEDTKQALGPANTNPWMSAAAGGLSGLLDTAAVAYLAAPFAKLFTTPAAEATLGALQGATRGEKLLNLVGEVAKGVGIGMFAEGSTEAVQEIIGAAATELQRTGDPRSLTERLMTPDNIQRYLEAGVSGMIFGGVFGAGHGGAHALEHSRGAPHAMAPQTGKVIDPQTGEAQPGAPVPPVVPAASTEAGTPPGTPGAAETAAVPPVAPPYAPRDLGTAPILNDRGAPEVADPNAGPSLEDILRREQFNRQLEQGLVLPTPQPMEVARNGQEAQAQAQAQAQALLTPITPGPTLNDRQAPGVIDPNAGPSIEDLQRRDQFNRQMEAARAEQAPPSPTPNATPLSPLDNAPSPPQNAPSSTTSPPQNAPPLSPLDGAPVPVDNALTALSGVQNPGSSNDRNTVGRNPVIGENVSSTEKVMGPSEVSPGIGSSPITPQAPVTAMESGYNIPTTQSPAPTSVDRGQVLPGSNGLVRQYGEPQGTGHQVIDKAQLPESKPTVADQRRAAPNLAPEKEAPPAPAAPVKNFPPDGSMEASIWVANTIRPQLPALQALEEATMTAADAEASFLQTQGDTRDSWMTSKETLAYLDRHPVLKALISRFAKSSEFATFLEEPVPGKEGAFGNEATMTDLVEAALRHFYPKASSLRDTRAEAAQRGQGDLFPNAPTITDLFPAGKDPTAPRPPDTPRNLRGHAKAQQLARAWRQLLGLKGTYEAVLSEAHQVAMAQPVVTDAQYEAIHEVARQVGSQVIQEHLAKADEATRQAIDQAWTQTGATDTTREAWLADRISEVLVHDAQMQQLYTDRGANLLFKWLRGVGLKLLQLVKAVRARLGFMEPAPPAAVAQFVRALVDRQRTQMAESLGISPLTTAELQNATNALLGEKPVPLDAIKRMLGNKAHPFYTPWLQALEQVVKATKAPEVRVKASLALRQAMGQIDPAWATQDQAARRRLRQRKFDRLPSLAGLQQASPEAADAVRKVLDALYTSEDALDRAGSLQRAALETQEPTPQRTTLAELLNETRQERLQDRRLRRAFLGALRRPHIRASEDRLAARDFTEAARWFDVLAPVEDTPERSLMRAKFLAKYDTMSKQMADFERRPTGREAGVLHTVWLALGLAQDEMPALVPTGKAWAEFGVQFDPQNTDVVAEVFGGVADYVARERLFERLPARHRDALAEAYLKNPGEQDIHQWLSEHLVRALESDPVLYQTVMLAEAAPGARLGYARHTTQHLLASALTYTGEPAHPAVRAALRHRLGNRYGTEALTKAEQVLLGTGDPSNLWFLLTQGVHLADGELRVNPEARARAQALIRAAGRLWAKEDIGPVDVMWEALGDEAFQRLAAKAPEIRAGKLPGAQSPALRTPGLHPLVAEATQALNGYYTRLAQYEDALDELSPHFDALLDTARTLKHDPALTTKQMVQFLLQWRDDLHRAPREAAPVTEALPGEELAAENTPNYTDTGVEDEANWMEQEMLYAVETGAIHNPAEGSDIGTEAEITDALGYEHNKEQEARPTILRQGLALFTEYTPRKKPKPGKTYDSDYGRPRARHYFKPIKTQDRFDVGTELNSNDATSIESSVAIDSKTGTSEPFAADLGHELFRQLPAETQSMLFERAQLLGRMGVEAEYRLARHKGERAVQYLDETLHLTDLSAIHTETMANGRGATELLLLDAVNQKLEKAKVEARHIPKDAQENQVVGFRVLAALDHPLLARIEAVMRRVLPLDELRRQWADQRGWAPGLDAQGRSKMPAGLRQAVEAATGKLRTAIEEDAELKSLTTESGQVQRLLAAALGYGSDVLSNRLPPKNAKWGSDQKYLQQLEQSDVPGHLRTTQPASFLEVDLERAEQLGLDRDRVLKARRLRLFDQKEEQTGRSPDVIHRTLDFLLRAYLDSYDPRTGTFDAGARATVTADALVGLGKDTLTGLEGSPDVYFNRVDKLARGIDLAGRMATPWASVEATPHLNPDLVLFRKWIKYKEPIEGRKGEFQEHTVAEELAQGADAQQMLETMGELDQDVQLAMLQLERTLERVRAGELQLGEQALNGQGQPLWTYRGVLPDEVQQWIDSIDKPSQFDAQPKAGFQVGDRPAAVNPKRKQFGWMNRFANNQGGESAPTLRRSAVIPPGVGYVSKAGEVYTARPHTHLDELTWVQTRLAGLRARISQLRTSAKETLTDQRSMGGSELNQFATFEEEFNDLLAWLDQMEIGDHQARVQTESQLFNPDLGSEGKKWDADLKAYQREGHTALAYPPGEQVSKTTRERAPAPVPEDVAPATLDSVAKEKAQAEKTAARSEQARQAREQKPLYLNFTPNEAAKPWTWSGDPSTPVGGQPRPATPRAPTTQTTSPQAALLSLVPAHAFPDEIALINRAVQKLGLDSKAMKVTFVDLDALQNSKDKIADLEKLGLAGLAEQVWNHGIMEPFFTTLEGGQARIILMNGRFVDGKFQKVTESELQDALAHELGHVFFHQRMSAALKDPKARGQLVKLLQDRLPPNYTDLHIEEATAEVVRGWLQGEATPPRPGDQTLVGKLTRGLIKGFRALLGLRPESKSTLDQLLAHAQGRARDAAGVRYYSGRQLLTDAGRLVGPSAMKETWNTMKALYDGVIRTTHSWLRSQRTITGEAIPALGLLADILRWTSGVAPKTQVLGGQLFDFDSTASDSYHQSYEAALTRYFARWGTRIEKELHSLTPEQQRQAVADYANGVETEQAQRLGKLFRDMGDYFGPVLKRHEGSKALPRIFDQKVLQEQREEFLTLMHSKGMSRIEAEQLHGRLSREQGTDYRADTGQFFAPHFQRAQQGDALDLISDRDLLPYLLVATQPQAALWQYTHQMVKRTEFERRFGGWVERGEGTALNDAVLPKLLSPNEVDRVEHYKTSESGYPLYRITRIVNGKPKEIKVNWDHTAKFRHLRAMAAKQGATQAQLNQVTRIMEAELGRYGADFSPRLRTLQSVMIAGMNWAVLPLSLFAQTTDLALPLLRSNGNFKLAWKGVKLALKALKEKEGNGLYIAARANGILAGNLRDYFASAYLDTPFIGTAAQKMNNTLFRLNGMEHATEFVRMYAFAMGHEWIQELAGKQTAEADVQLAQLGLHRADVLAWQQHQQLDTGAETTPEVERVQQALNLFVEQSMFRPSASQRPAWASHPAAMLVWYLKSYIWSYADTILGRAWREFQRQDDWGKKALVASMPFLIMMPLAALGLLLRDELRDSLPLPWRKPRPQGEDDATEYMARLVSRTGLFGPMQMLLDAGRASEYGNPYYLSLIGPFATMPDQLIRGVASSANTGRALTDALLRISPILGSLPQERKALLGAIY